MRFTPDTARPRLSSGKTTSHSMARRDVRRDWAHTVKAGGEHGHPSLPEPARMPATSRAVGELQTTDTDLPIVAPERRTHKQAVCTKQSFSSGTDFPEASRQDDAALLESMGRVYG